MGKTNLYCISQKIRYLLAVREIRPWREHRRSLWGVGNVPYLDLDGGLSSVVHVHKVVKMCTSDMCPWQNVYYASTKNKLKNTIFALITLDLFVALKPVSHTFSKHFHLLRGSHLSVFSPPSCCLSVTFARILGLYVWGSPRVQSGTIFSSLCTISPWVRFSSLMNATELTWSCCSN